MAETDYIRVISWSYRGTAAEKRSIGIFSGGIDSVGPGFDGLGFVIGQLFPEGSYVEYNNDFTNLELQIRKVVENETFRKQVTNLAKHSVKKYAWAEFADNWVVPTICSYLEEKRK